MALKAIRNPKKIDKPMKASGVCVIVPDKSLEKTRVLLAKRLNSYKAGMFGVPGGRLELDESLTDCAKRKLREETGLDAKSLRTIGVIIERQEDMNFIHFVLLCEDYTGKLSVKEPHK